MAARRMMVKELVESPDFEGMSKDACFALLMFHLYADDDGYIKLSEAIFRGKCSLEVIQEIITAGWVEMNNNIIMIDKWETFQTIKKDRYTPSNLKKYFKGKDPAGKKPFFPEHPNHVASTKELTSKEQKEFFEGYQPEPKVLQKGFKRPAEILADKMKLAHPKKRGGAKKEWQSICAGWVKKVGTFKEEDIPIIYKAFGDHENNLYPIENIMVAIMELKPRNPIAYFNDLYSKLKKVKK